MIGGLVCLFTVTLAGLVWVGQVNRRVPENLHWLIDSGCKFPCWRGVTPGRTRFLEASRILREQPDVKLTAAEYTSGYNSLSVQFEVRTPQGLLRGEMTSNESATAVQYIYFYSLNADGKGWLRLADLITLVGSPLAMMQDGKGSSMVRLNYGGFEALNFPWLLFPQNREGGCQRWNVLVGLYLGVDPNFESPERWRGFGSQFDRWCNATP